MIEPGKVLQQRYRIDKQIGQGGMGAVFVATDERFGSTVAIKETLCMDDNFRKALEREARLLNSLKHAALPRVSDHFIEENGQFLVMEYIPGNDLAFILEETNKPFSFERVQRWADELLDALEFLHTQSLPVIHRDIKPQNLKLTSKDQIVLLDFGLAKGNPTDAGMNTAAKSIFGYSRNYASLEQIQGTGTDPRSDLYSLAATLYHLSTGQVPEDALTRAMAVLSGQPDPLTPANSIYGGVPTGFAGVLQKALDLNASSRPGSAHEMREMFRNMDSYAHLAVSGGQKTSGGVVEFGAEKTQLMPGVTRQGSDRQTGIKTEVLPALISEETAVRTGGNRPSTLADGQIAVPRTRRRFALAGASIVLLLGGLAAAGAYVYQPAFIASPEPAVSESKTDAQAQAPPSNVEPAAETNTASSETSASAETAAAAKDEQIKDEPERVRGKTTSKSERSGPSQKASSNTSVDGDDLDMDGKTIYVGNMKIKNGKIETPDAFIDEDGIRPKVPPVPRTDQYDGPNMRHLTPKQRREIIELRRKGIIPPARRAQPRQKY